MKRWVITSIVLFVLLLINSYFITILYNQIQLLKKQTNSTTLSDITISGESLVIKNEKGTKIAEISPTINGGRFVIYNDKEKPMFEMLPWTNGGAFNIYNNQGVIASYISTQDLGSVIGLNDFLGKPKVGIAASTYGGSIFTFDDKGTLSGSLGDK